MTGKQKEAQAAYLAKAKSARVLKKAAMTPEERAEWSRHRGGMVKARRRGTKPPPLVIDEDACDRVREDDDE